jgi:hypothetical protein
MSIYFENFETELKLQMAMKLAPAWPDETGVQPFTWPYGPRELIAERKKVCEIMVLRAKVEKPVDHGGNPTKTGYPLSFQDAFVPNDNTRTSLMLEINSFQDWRSLVVKQRLDTFPVGPSGTAERRAKRESDWCAEMNVYYGWIKGFLGQTSNNLLEMQALCSELKPETLALVKRCSNYEELDRSMMMMKPHPTAEGFPFTAPNDPVQTPKISR